MRLPPLPSHALLVWGPFIHKSAPSALRRRHYRCARWLCAPPLQTNFPHVQKPAIAETNEILRGAVYSLNNAELFRGDDSSSSTYRSSRNLRGGAHLVASHFTPRLFHIGAVPAAGK